MFSRENHSKIETFRTQIKGTAGVLMYGINMRLLKNFSQKISYDPNFQDNWYRNNYEKVNVTAIKGSFFKYVLHKSIELGAGRNDGLNILEVGTNNGEHLRFVESGWKNLGSYIACDVREPDLGSLEYFESQGVKFVLASLEDLPFEDNSFDRIILTCVLHHVNNPERAILELRRVLKPGGKLSILLPNDPGLMYRLSRAFTTLPIAISKGLFWEVQLNHALEHKGNFLSLFRLLRYIFGNDKMKVLGWPFFFSTYSFNVFSTIQITKIDLREKTSK